MTIKEIVRQLRQNQTTEEKVLWYYLRNRQVDGYKFIRQYPIIYGNEGHNKSNFFVADFYCAKKRLVIEIDGKIHEFQKEQDKNRDGILKSMNFRVLRIKNEEVTDVNQVLDKIRKALEE